jgi:hypothetical protein
MAPSALTQNGILIVALLFAYGVHTGNSLLIFFAFALAGLSYLVNLAAEFNLVKLGNVGFKFTAVLGVVAYVFAARQFFGV